MWTTRVNAAMNKMKTYVLSVDGRDYTVTRKKVKNLILKIRNAGAYVTAPVSVSDDRIISFIREHYLWTEKHLKKAERKRGKAYLFGREYLRLDVEWERAFAEFGEDGICTVFGKDERARERALLEYYKAALSPLMAPLFEKWQKETGLSVGKVEITTAKTYLGRCLVKERRIRMSCRLAAKSKSVIDYVVLHEICHLKYANHQREFYALIEKYMPDYRQRIKLMKGR